MPILEYPFIDVGGACPPRPMLPVRIYNPSTGKYKSTFAVIDTGADDCAVPDYYADLVGHELHAGEKIPVSTGGGSADAYAHTTQIDIIALDPNSKSKCKVRPSVAYTIEPTKVHYVKGLDSAILGVNGFLSNFILIVDYKRKVFSVRFPSENLSICNREPKPCASLAAPT